MYGLDFLGLPKYAEVAKDEFPEGWALGAFAVTFGDAYKAVEAIVATGRCPLVRMQLLWSDSHTFGDSNIPEVKKLAAKYNQMAAKYPNVKFELSPFCEHNLKNPDKYLDITKLAAPLCRPVNTPWKGAFSTKYKNESHGKNSTPKGARNFSFDGYMCVDSDIEDYKKKHASAEVFFFWTSQFNGKKNDKDNTPRPQRKAWPTSELIDSVIYLHRSRGKTGVPKKYIWKSHADQHETPPESRALKPVLISPVKASKYELVASNGQVVASLKYYGTYEGGLYRYYLMQYGYQVSEKARRIQGGDPVCSLRVNGKVVGWVNPAYRDGTYR